jgi:DNA invertase Pin-like site-specific DNA recombinase
MRPSPKGQIPAIARNSVDFPDPEGPERATFSPAVSTRCFVSTMRLPDGQTLASQDSELMAAGCAKVYQEKVSGARTDRAELGKLLRRIEAGDLLIVTRLDRLARSTRDLLNILHQLAEKGAKFKSLHDPWCDTSTPQGELLVTILAGFATFERHLIKARTDDGRKRAKARGVRFGRPRALDQHQRQEALERLANGETLVDVARTYGVDPTTIGRLQSPFVPESVAA